MCWDKQIVWPFGDICIRFVGWTVKRGVWFVDNIRGLRDCVEEYTDYRDKIVWFWS